MRHAKSAAYGSLIGLLMVALVAQPALAIDATSPITAANGTIACPTCTVGTPSQYGLPVWGSSQTLGTINPTSQTTYFLRSKGTGANPAFEALAIGDIPSDTAANWAAKIGTPTGSGGEFVRATSPTITSPTISTSINLPSSAVDAIGEIASSIQKGTANATKIVTTTSASTTTNNCAKWDSDGNLVDSGGTCGGASINPILALSTYTPVTVAAATPVYLSLSGDVSTTETNVQTPIKNAATFSSFQCVVNAGTTNAVTAVLGVGTCGSTASYTSKAQVVLSSSANTAGTSSGSTAVTAGQCVTIKLTASSDATAATLHCSVERSA